MRTYLEGGLAIALFIITGIVMAGTPAYSKTFGPGNGFPTVNVATVCVSVHGPDGCFPTPRIPDGNDPILKPILPRDLLPIHFLKPEGELINRPGVPNGAALLVRSPWIGSLGKFRNTSLDKGFNHKTRIYDVYPDGTVIFRTKDARDADQTVFHLAGTTGSGSCRAGNDGWSCEVTITIDI